LVVTVQVVGTGLAELDTAALAVKKLKRQFRE
jgi:hypothetical protein